MFEICISGFLVTSIPASFLLWRILTAAKRGDYGLYQLGNTYKIEATTKLASSGND
jgi:hypothetical protein